MSSAAMAEPTGCLRTADAAVAAGAAVPSSREWQGPLPQHLKVHVRDVEHLEQVIDRFTPFGVTTTSIMQSSPVPGRGPALPAPD
jgi:hypothetical protein